jgi:hypothetical protein
MSDEEVISLLDKLPHWHVSNPPLSSIRYVDKTKIRNPKDRRKFPDQILGECIITNEGRKADILIYRQKERGNDALYDFRLCILHEIGHVVFESLPKVKQNKWYSLYFQNQTLVIWNEAGRDQIEHFCDTYARLILTPLLVEKRFRKEYRYMQKEVFN